MSIRNSKFSDSIKTIFDLRISVTVVSLALIAALSHTANSSEGTLVDIAGTVRPLNALTMGALEPVPADSSKVPTPTGLRIVTSQ
jgi:hypothetical protein